MIFLQPWMLWGLAAAALPVIIHFLNRLRFKTVRWGAMMFLLRASRSSTRHARLRQWLILACRTLALLAFAVALSRPLVGGWLGASLYGAPDMVLILLDRSASMEDTDPRLLKSRRQQVLDVFAATSRENASSRFVLIDSVGLEPMEIAGTGMLSELAATAPTDTAADIPAMFRTAAEYLARNPAGRAEIWVGSDMQHSNWRPESREWQDIESRLAALPHGLRTRVLALSAPVGYNRTLTLLDAVRTSVAGQPVIDMALEIRKTDDGSDTFPLTLAINGARSTRDISMSGRVMVFRERIPVQDDKRGSLRIELPADDNPRDHHVYAAYAPEVTLKTVVVGQHQPSMRLLGFAAAPHPALPRQVQTVDARQATAVLATDPALVIWQEGSSGGALRALEQYVERGGVALLMPPDGEGERAPFGLSWSAVENAQEGNPFRVVNWDEREGPLARTADGVSLPVDRVEYMRRRLALRDGDDGLVRARFADGRPFLTRYSIGEGYIYACASLPDAEWSNLGESIVLLPMIQRLIRQGGERFQPARRHAVGEWKPDGDLAGWLPSDADASSNPLIHSGVYFKGEQMVALNRPTAEDDERRLDAARTETLMPGLRVDVTERLAADHERAMRVEIWPWLVVLAVLFLLAEAALTLTTHVSGSTTAGRV